MKKILSGLLVLLIVLQAAFYNVQAVPNIDNLDDTQEIRETLSISSNSPINIFVEANILRGTDNGYELDRTLTRLEGLILLVRLLGYEEEALEFDISDMPFDDVPLWGANYVAFAVDMGLVKGVTEDSFKPNDRMHYKSFYTLMLRTLNYSDSSVDFNWFNADEVADDVNIAIAKDFDELPFTRNDAVDIMMKTLNAPMKLQSDTLVEYLVKEKQMDLSIAELIDPNLFTSAVITGANSSVISTQIVPTPKDIEEDKEVSVSKPSTSTSSSSSSSSSSDKDSDPEPENDSESSSEAETKPEAEPEAEPDSDSTSDTEVVADADPEPVIEPDPEPVVEPDPEPVVEPEATPEPEEETVVSVPSASIDSSGGVYAADIGMVPNNRTKKVYNAQKLNEAINKYGKVIIEDVYYIGDYSESVTAKNIELLGEGDAELVFDINKTKIMFGANEIDNISIKNIKFTNVTSDEYVLIVYSRDDDPTYVNSVVFDHCVFTGDMSAYRQKGNKYANPETTVFGINSFIFTNNRVTNTGVTFLMFIDLPFNEVVISNNQINNFQSIFANLSLSNGIKYNSLLREKRNFIRVNNNIVINDDDWWGEDSSMYHAFILAENNEIIYKNNYVEGVKAKADVAVYDAYLSCLDVSYVNNTWVNNICFYGNKHNTLMKAKSGVDGDRLYKDNTFIVEETFAEQVGQSTKYLYVQFIDINQQLGTYRIEDNTFDIYDLRFQTSSREVKEYIFTGNKINAKYASGKMFITKLVDDYQSSITFTDNEIRIEQDEYRNVTGDPNQNRFGLIETVDSRRSSKNEALDLVFTDNIIVAPITYAFHNVTCDSVEVEANEIYVVESLYKKFSYDGNQPQLETISVEFQ